MRTTLSSPRNEKNPLWQAVKKAEAGDFSSLQDLLKKPAINLDWRAPELEGDKGRAPLVVFFNAVINAFNSRNETKINLAVQLLQTVLLQEKNILNNILMTTELSKAISSLSDKLRTPAHIKMYAMFTSQLAENAESWVFKPEFRFSDSVREAQQHQKQSSQSFHPAPKRKIKEVVKAKPAEAKPTAKVNPIEDTLKLLPRLDKNILKFDDIEAFQQLVSAIAIWDAHCVSDFTYHSPKKIMADKYVGLDSWLILSLLHARLNNDEFKNVISNMCYLRDELCKIKKYNSACAIDNILNNPILGLMIDKDEIGEEKFTDFQKTLERKKLSIYRPREIVNSLHKMVASSKLTIPLGSLNNLLALVTEVEPDSDTEASESEAGQPVAKAESSVKIFVDFIKAVKERLAGDAELLATTPWAKALSEMPRVTLDQLGEQIDEQPYYDEEGKKYRKWLTGPAFIEAFPEKKEEKKVQVSKELVKVPAPIATAPSLLPAQVSESAPVIATPVVVAVVPVAKSSELAPVNSSAPTLAISGVKSRIKIFEALNEDVIKAQSPRKEKAPAKEAAAVSMQPTAIWKRINPETSSKALSESKEQVHMGSRLGRTSKE